MKNKAMIGGNGKAVVVEIDEAKLAEGKTTKGASSRAYVLLKEWNRRTNRNAFCPS